MTNQLNQLANNRFKKKTFTYFHCTLIALSPLIRYQLYLEKAPNSTTIRFVVNHKFYDVLPCGWVFTRGGTAPRLFKYRSIFCSLPKKYAQKPKETMQFSLYVTHSGLDFIRSEGCFVASAKLCRAISHGHPSADGQVLKGVQGGRRIKSVSVDRSKRYAFETFKS